MESPERSTRLRSLTPNASTRSISPGARSVSPKKMPAGIDEGNPVYQSAMTKLIDASMRFDRETTGQLLLKALENRELEKKYFRHTLKTKMDCRLTEEELETLMPFFDNKGLVNGCEFILLFYRLRFENRAKFLTERIEREKKLAIEAKQRADKRKSELFKKCTVAISYDFTPEEQESAMKKLADAAFLYDRLMPGSVQLDGFESESMNLDIFKDQLRRVFNLQYTPAEFGALVKQLPSAGEDKIHCASFLVMFFRLGFKERSERLRAKYLEKKRIDAEREAKRIADKEELERKNALQVNFDFTKDDQLRALKKLKEAARLYDKTTPAATSMKSFEVAFMPPHVFKEQLKRVLNLQLTPQELGALMRVYDENGDGTVSCEEFEKTFLAMGFQEREQMRRDEIAKQKRAEEARKAEAERIKQEQAMKNAMKCTFDFTEKEYASAMAKLTEAAWRYDKTMPGAPCMDAFEAQFMEAHEFKEQVKQALGIQVTAAELGAILTYFHCNELGQIKCQQFLGKFTLMGVQERAKRLRLWRDHQQEMEKRRLALKEAKLHRLEEKNIIQLQQYTEEDFNNALSKLTVAAMKISRHEMGSASLEAFEPVSIPPHVFREQLKMVFNLKTTTAELSALMAYFDREGKGEINCRDFLIQFFRTGLEERYRLRVGWRQEQQAKKERDEKAAIDAEEKKFLRALREVDYDFTEAEFDTALRKLILMCHQFDYRQLGPAGWKAFQGASLTPSEFRETLKRTFNVKVTPQELGALVTYFDASLKGSVNCSNFLNIFVQLRVKCEEFKGKPNETELLDSYHVELKELYRLRIQKQVKLSGQPEVKPWRVIVKKRVIEKLRNPYPISAMQKLRLRLQAGRKSLRMDLSSKVCWPHLTASSSSALFRKSDTEIPTIASAPVIGESKSPADQTDLPSAATTVPDSLPEEASERKLPPAQPAASDDAASETKEIPTATYVNDVSAGKSETSETQVASETEEKERGIAELDLEEQLRAQQRVTGHGDDEIVVVKDSDGTDLVVLESFVIEEAAQEAIDYLAVQSIAISKTNRKKKYAVDDAKMEANLKKALEDLNPVELLECLTNPTVKHNIIAAQIMTPDLDFLLYSMPQAVFRVTDLRELWLTNNALSSIPSKIGELKQLTTLCLAGNKLVTIPPEICLLENLERLNLQRNQLNELPGLFGRLQSLTWLNLSFNVLTLLPTSLCSLAKLEYLDVTCNRISDFPPELIRLKSLITLHMGNNVGMQFAPNVLLKMKWLELSGCPSVSVDRGPVETTPMGDSYDDLEQFIRSRASSRITAKLRRRKGKSKEPPKSVVGGKSKELSLASESSVPPS